VIPVPIGYRTPGVYVEWLDPNPQHIVPRRTDVAGFVGIAERGPFQEPMKVESYRQFVTTFGDRIPDSYLAYVVAGFFENGGRRCWVVRVVDPDAARPARIRLLVEGWEPLVVEATSPGAWGNDIAVEAQWGRDRILQLRFHATGRADQTLDLEQVSRSPRSTPRVQTNLLGVSTSALPELEPDRIVEIGADGSWVSSQELNARTPSARLTGGSDGVESLTPDHFTGHPDKESTWGVAALERVDEVALVAVPDLMVGQDPTGRTGAFGGFDRGRVQNAQLAIINSCMQRNDRVAILDLPPVSRDQAIEYKGALPRISTAALYHPWIAVDDPLRLSGLVRSIPPSGHVAGMFARTDRLRGVHKPPANEVLEGVFDLREHLDDEAHGTLNESAINAIRAVPGRGIRVLGARTLDPDVRWRYVNVRRLFSMIEESLEEEMQWVTFEPNNPRLWRDIDRSVRGFLERLYRAGMLDGATSEQAYLVRCDASTNPPSDTDVGKVQCVVGIQPPYPAEFVIVRIGVTRSGIEIEEKGAQDG
jgi:phage tail sheath protein FI